MLIEFLIGQTTAAFKWSAMTGRAELRVGARLIALQDPARLSTHFDLGTTRRWTCHHQGHDVDIVKVRPRLLAGFRKNCFTVSVDGERVAQARGR